MRESCDALVAGMRDLLTLAKQSMALVEKQGDLHAQLKPISAVWALFLG